MRWVAKALVHKGLDQLPWSESTNFFLQRHLTRSVPRPEKSFHSAIEGALESVRRYERHATVPVAQASFYEFGAGWDLLGPLVYQRLGVRSQHLVDVRPNARPWLVQDATMRLGYEQCELSERVGRELAPGPTAVSELSDLADFGIRYEAPADARSTGMPDDSVDAVTGYSVMQHVPRGVLASIVHEMRRILRPGGLFLAYVDMEDLYADMDSSVGPYNFMRFSDRTWAIFNSGLHYQNRLRARDYIALLESEGFDLVERHEGRPEEEELKSLLALPVAECFREQYSLEELLPLSLHLVAVKRG